MKCLYTNVDSVRSRQEELEALAQSQSYDIVGRSETCWEKPCEWSAVMDGARLSRRERRGRRRCGVVLRVKEGLDCTALAAEDNMVESLCLKIRGKAKKADVLAGVCYGSPSQDDDTDA